MIRVDIISTVSTCFLTPNGINRISTVEIRPLVEKPTNFERMHVRVSHYRPDSFRPRRFVYYRRKDLSWRAHADIAG